MYFTRMTHLHAIRLVTCIILALMFSCKSSQEVSQTSVPDDTSFKNDSIYQAILKERLGEEKKFEHVQDIDRPEQGASKEETHSLVPVYFGTDRKPSGNTGPYEFFSSDKGNGEIHYGKCLVSVPKLHSIGEIERPKWWKLEFSEDPEKHIIMKEVKPYEQESFFADMRSSAAGADKKEALVFIHGYNVSFDDAALRTAQLVYDLGFGGVPIFYSWPSQGGLMSYLVDGERNAWTVPHLKAFLEEILQQVDFDHVHIIAHSMGNRAFTEALTEIAEEYRDSTLFDQIILAAPDIDRDIFIRDIAPNIKGVAKNITLYASSKDRALNLSEELHQNPRVGEGGENIVVIDGIESVDASLIDTDFLGHSYFANTWLLIDDIYKLVNKGLGADQRKLTPDFKGQKKYWILK